MDCQRLSSLLSFSHVLFYTSPSLLVFSHAFLLYFFIPSFLSSVDSIIHIYSCLFPSYKHSLVPFLHFFTQSLHIVSFFCMESFRPPSSFLSFSHSFIHSFASFRPPFLYSFILTYNHLFIYSLTHPYIAKANIPKNNPRQIPTILLPPTQDKPSLPSNAQSVRPPFPETLSCEGTGSQARRSGMDDGSCTSWHYPRTLSLLLQEITMTFKSLSTPPGSRHDLKDLINFALDLYVSTSHAIATSPRPSGSYHVFLDLITPSRILSPLPRIPACPLCSCSYHLAIPSRILH